MKTLLSLLLLCQLSCGFDKACQSRPLVYRNTKHIDTCFPLQLSTKIHPELEPFVNQFSADALNRDIPCHYIASIGFFSVQTSDLGNIIGYCQAPFTVRIYKPFWINASPEERLALIYHELGHCALGLEHYDKDLDIMNTYLLHTATVLSQWDSLVNTLFERARK